jgi:hypothetical protein
MRLEKEMVSNSIWFYFGKKDDAKGTHRIYLYGQEMSSTKEMETVANGMRQKPREELESLVTTKKMSDFSVSILSYKKEIVI